MALSSSAKAALKLLTALDIDVKKTYRLERRVEKLRARMQGSPGDYRVWDQEVLNGSFPVPVRIFFPAETARSAILFFHGGGWVSGGIENYTSLCIELAKVTGCIVASVDYRLAPEFRFPIGLEDCYAVAQEFFMGNTLGITPENIILMGDSAGGNLAAAVSLMARDRNHFLPQYQILLYPAVNNDYSANSPFPSVRENGTGYLLTSKRVQRVLELYMSHPNDLNNPYLAPLLAKDLTRQPRTLVITAEYCPLRDEGETYGKKLAEAGNQVEICRINDAVHAFMMLPPKTVYVKEAHEAICSFLNRASMS